MTYDGWPNLVEKCLNCGRPNCAIYKGYYKRFLFCPELEFRGVVIIRTALCKNKKVRYALMPEFILPRRRISRLSLELLVEKRAKYPNRLIDAIDELLEGLEEEFYLPISTAYVYIKLFVPDPPE
jgi:hypothetical protein